ncbi:hypothetical protein ACFE04_013519 [Oxalis oulophora]
MSQQTSIWRKRQIHCLRFHERVFMDGLRFKVLDSLSQARREAAEVWFQGFLEALKFYGRGWRQIEEHIGSKTIVKIRSHAQKFFSKMVRESSNCTESCIKPLHMALQQFKQWVKPIKPLGVVGAIAAGTSAVLKPSEVAPATSSLLAKLFGKYLDASLVKVIEGSVAETTALLICKSEI